MKTCANCKHWGAEPYEYHSHDGDDDGDDDNGVGRKHVDPHRRCTLLKLWSPYDGPRDDSALPFLRDGSDYKAELWTPPDWTCPRFEQRDTEMKP